MGKAVLMALLCTSISMPLRGQPEGQPRRLEKPTDAKTTEPQRDQRGMKGSPIFVDIEQHPESEAEAAKTEKDNRRKERNDLVVAWSAGLAAFFTGLLVIVGWRGVRAAISTLRAIEGQTKALIEGQSPRIAIEPHGNLTAMILEPTSPRIELEISNNGVTPAHQFTYETWIEVLPEPFIDFTSKADHVPPTTPIVMYPLHPVIINVPIRPLITPDQMREIKKLSLKVCVRVRVTYSDAFSPKRCFNFGFMVMHNGLGFLPKYHGDCSDSEKPEKQKAN